MPCLMDSKLIGNDEDAVISMNNDVNNKRELRPKSEPVEVQEIIDNYGKVVEIRDNINEEDFEDPLDVEVKKEIDEVEFKEMERKREKRRSKRREWRKQKKILDDPNAPKRNRSAYVHFIIEYRAVLGNGKSLPQKDINSILAAKWQTLTPEQRMPYHELAEKEKQKYLQEMEEYKKTPEYAQFQNKNMLRLKRKSEKEECEDFGESPEKIVRKMPPSSEFCPMLNGENPSTSGPKFVGNVLSHEFMTYNKARDSYRRQLQKERATIEHELDALANHDMEHQINDQLKTINDLNNQIENIMKTMRNTMGNVRSAHGHLDDIESLTAWLRTSAKSPATRKAIKDSILMRVI